MHPIETNQVLDSGRDVQPRRARSHEMLDHRSLALHALIVETIRRDPSLMDKVRKNLTRWSQSVCENTQPYVRAWRELLDQGDEAILAAAVAKGEHADAMRQASPFAGVLPPKVRSRFLKEWREGVPR